MKQQVCQEFFSKLAESSRRRQLSCLLSVVSLSHRPAGQAWNKCGTRAVQERTSFLIYKDTTGCSVEGTSVALFGDLVIRRRPRGKCTRSLRVADLKHGAVEGHEAGLHSEVWVFRMNGARQQIKLLFVRSRLFRELGLCCLLWKVLMQQNLVSAAIAMIDDHHIFYVMQVAGDLDVLPKGEAPLRIRRVVYAERSSGELYVIVMVVLRILIHVPLDRSDQAKVHAAEQKRVGLVRRVRMKKYAG
jgi:hypothetical protein